MLKLKKKRLETNKQMHVWLFTGLFPAIGQKYKSADDLDLVWEMWSRSEKPKDAEI